MYALELFHSFLFSGPIEFASSEPVLGYFLLGVSLWQRQYAIWLLLSESLEFWLLENDLSILSN